MEAGEKGAPSLLGRGTEREAKVWRRERMTAELERWALMSLKKRRESSLKKARFPAKKSREKTEKNLKECWCLLLENSNLQMAASGMRMLQGAKDMHSSTREK